MKRHILLLLLGSFAPLFLQAQNTVPVLSNLTASVDWNTNILIIQYDVSDTENDPLEVTIDFSNNEGRTFEFSGQVPVSGDVGFPVMPGSNRSITADVSALAGQGAALRLRLVADDRQPVDLHELVSQVDSTLLHDNLTFVEGVRHRTTGLTHLNEVRDSMSTLFSSLNLHTEIQSFPYSGTTGKNIIGSLAGTVAADTVVVVDAHYDSVSNAPGADDNGSGTVGVWEIARILSQYPSRNTLRFIGFDLEEAGLQGSAAYVSSGMQAGETIEGVFNFEMIGYYSDEPNSQELPAGFNLLFPVAANAVAANQYRGDFITNVGNDLFPQMTSLFESSANTYVPGLKVITVSEPIGLPVLDLRRSDHTPFWVSGIPAIMITDGANFRNECYHTPGDTLNEKLNFTFMSNVVKATLVAAARLAGIQHAAWATVDFAGTVRTHDLQQTCQVAAGIYPPGSRQPALFFGSCPVSGLQVELFNAGGVLQFREHIGQPLETTWHTLALPHLDAGLYFLRLQSTEGNQTLKVVVH
ncbi:MAG: M28 family peptidase [Bacteroidetes bacterium]|nr:MAG: M28 family peptidase [Bacteroidota bacterium]